MVYVQKTVHARNPWKHLSYKNRCTLLHNTTQHTLYENCTTRTRDMVRVIHILYAYTKSVVHTRLMYYYTYLCGDVLILILLHVTYSNVVTVTICIQLH